MMTCPDCAKLREQLAEAEKERDFYRKMFGQVVDAVNAYKQPWWAGLNEPPRKDQWQ